MAPLFSRRPHRISWAIPADFGDGTYQIYKPDTHNLMRPHNGLIAHGSFCHARRAFRSVVLIYICAIERTAQEAVGTPSSLPFSFSSHRLHSRTLRTFYPVSLASAYLRGHFGALKRKASRGWLACCICNCCSVSFTTRTSSQCTRRDRKSVV